jgi:hypothetical protein
VQKHKLPKTGFFQIGFMGFHLFSPFTNGKAVHSPLNSAITKGFKPYTKATLMPLGNWQAFGRFLELVVRRGAVKGLGLKDAPTSPEREFKTLHRIDA